MQRFETRFEAEAEPDEEYKKWMDLYHPQTSRKLLTESNSAIAHVSVFVPTSASDVQKKLPEVVSISLPKTIGPKAAALGRVLTSAENLKNTKRRES